MKCPTRSQDVPKDAKGLVQARVATRIHAERAARRTAQELVRVTDTLRTIAVARGWEPSDWDACVLQLSKDDVWAQRRAVGTVEG